MKKLKWLIKTACAHARAWRRSKNDELRELDAFRKCVRLERKAVEYPYAVPLLTELMASLHFQHIQGFLRISHDNAVMVCDALIRDSLLSSYDMATGKYPVLKMS